MSLSRYAASLAERIRSDADDKAAWLQAMGGTDDAVLRDGNADSLAELAKLVADLAELLEPIQ